MRDTILRNDSKPLRSLYPLQPQRIWTSSVATFVLCPVLGKALDGEVRSRMSQVRKEWFRFVLRGARFEIGDELVGIV